MTRTFGLMLAAATLAGCSIINPQDPLGLDGPGSPPKSVLGKAAPMNVQYDSFLAAYLLAAYDDWLIASGQGSTSNSALESGNLPVPDIPPTFLPDLKRGPAITSTTTHYSPLASQTYTQTDIDNLKKSSQVGTVTGGAPGSTAGTVTLQFKGDSGDAPTIPTGTKIAIAGVNPAGYNGASIVVSGSGPGSVTYPNATVAKWKSGGTISSAIQNLPNAGDPKPGGSLQSIHARALAQRGAALADQYCGNFFAAKADAEQIGIVSNDAWTSVVGVAGIAGGAAGAATGKAAAPSATSIITGLFGSYKTVLSEDFLFGQSNISDTYALVLKAEATDTAANLPEPDKSDWNFQRAIQVIKQHGLICHPEQILSLIKSSTSNAKLCSTPAISAAGSGQTPASGSPPSGATSAAGASASRPATSASSVTAAPAGGGC